MARNFGQIRAITAGLDKSRGDWVVVMDCDLQDRPETIPELYQKAQEGYDVVFARREGRKDSAITKFLRQQQRSQPRRHDKAHHRGQDHHYRRPVQGHQGLTHGVPQGVDVRGGPGDQLGGGDVVDVGKGKALNLPQQGAAHVPGQSPGVAQAGRYDHVRVRRSLQKEERHYRRETLYRAGMCPLERYFYTDLTSSCSGIAIRL